MLALSNTQSPHTAKEINFIRAQLVEIANVLSINLEQAAPQETPIKASPPANPVQAQTPTRSEIAALARRLTIERRQRDKILNSSKLVGEPAWEMLLDLFYAEFVGRKISISSACIASAAPPTTALRYMAQLEKEGLIERIPSPNDRRVIFAQLSHAAFSMMYEYLECTFIGRLKDSVPNSETMLRDVPG